LRLSDSRKVFFFEKKKQKTFIHLDPELIGKSLFASFSSEKEVLTFSLRAA